MSKFIKSGNSYKVFNDENLNVKSELPGETFVVKFDEITNSFFLEGITPFTECTKLYGKTVKHTSRILATFFDREDSTGVLLTGEKGSGKTLLAKNISTTAASHNIPTILVNEKFAGTVFNEFIQSIDQRAIVIFDEFEKIYDSDRQESMLTLMDGVFPSKKLFIFTCNGRWRLNDNMINRPGRLFYKLSFNGLETDAVIEYCQDNLINKDHIDRLVKFTLPIKNFNFDMLKALVEEMNRFDESPHEAIDMLNIDPGVDNADRYDITVKDIHNKLVTKTTSQINPLSVFGVRLDQDDEDDDSCEYDDGYVMEKSSENTGTPPNVVRVTPDDIVSLDINTNSFVYKVNKDNETFVVTAKKVSDSVYDVWRNIV